MDDTDRKLLVLISAEPRMHFRELAKRLGISKQAVHHRMQVLMEIGVIQGMTAGISIHYLDAIPVVVFGKSKTASIEETLSRLGKGESVRRASVAAGNFLYVAGLLRGITELDNYVELVKREAEMPNPTVGIFSIDAGLLPAYPLYGGGKRMQSYKELSPLDFRIIAALKDDARKPVADIAEMVGVTPKTARQHLENMISEGSLVLDVPLDLAPGGDVFYLIHVSLRDGADKAEVGRRLLSKHSFQDQYVRTFSNLPSFLIWAFWSGNMTEMRKVLRELQEDEDVLAAMPNIVYLERAYTTWRDKVPEVHTSTAKEARTKRQHSGPRKR